MRDPGAFFSAFVACPMAALPALRAARFPAAFFAGGFRVAAWSGAAFFDTGFFFFRGLAI
jgi:hypothetical protein